MEMKYTEKQTLAEKTAQNLLEMIQEKGYGAGDLSLIHISVLPAAICFSVFSRVWK